MLKLFYRLVEILTAIGSAISGIGWLFLVLLIVADVILRHTFKSAVPGSISFSCMIMAFSLLLGFGKTQEDKQNISVDFFIDKIFKTESSKKSWSVVVNLFAILFFSLILIEAIESFQISLRIREYYGGAKIRVPIYPARGAIVAGCFLIIIQLVKDILQVLFNKYHSNRIV